MASSVVSEDRNWMANDISRKAAIRSDWRVWPPVIFVGVVVLTLLFQVPLIASIVGGTFGALVTAAAVRSGQQRIVVRIAVKDTELVWIDRGGRTHNVSLAMIQNIQEIPRQTESIIWYVDRKGARDGFGVGPAVAEAVRKGLELYWERQRDA